MIENSYVLARGRYVHVLALSHLCLNFSSRISRVHGRRLSRSFHTRGASCLSGRCFRPPLMDYLGSTSHVRISDDILLVDWPSPSPFLSESECYF